MKKTALALLFCLLLTALSGCGPQTDAPPPPEEPLYLETLTVELSRGGADPAALSRAVKELPELLVRLFGETEVPVESVRVTVGSSPAGTAAALAEGGVQLAFLPAQSLFLSEENALPLLAEAVPGEETARGTRSLLCAAPSPYGLQLSERAEKGSSPLTWEELSAARWGVLASGPAGGADSLDLYLSDRYEGSRLGELPRVQVYDSWEALLRAAASEEVDALVLREDVREGFREAWALSGDRTDAGGMHGFGREDILRELPVLDRTEPLFRQLAAVSPAEEALSDPRFREALTQALSALAEERPELMPLLGAEAFAPVSEEDLAPTRRLTFLG